MDWERIRSNWQHYKRYAQAMQISALYGISSDTAQMPLESWQGRLAGVAPPL